MCGFCKTPLPAYEFGRPAKFCSTSCRLKAHRAERAARRREVERLLVERAPHEDILALVRRGL